MLIPSTLDISSKTQKIPTSGLRTIFHTWRVKPNSQFVPVHDTKPYVESEVTAPLILTDCTR